jgi:hypothetical protein
MGMKRKVLNKHLNEFLGQKVNVVTELHQMETQSEDSTMISTQNPLVFAGFLLDYDDLNYYLSDEEGELKQIIRIAKTVGIQLDPDFSIENVEDLLAKNEELN